MNIPRTVLVREGVLDSEKLSRLSTDVQLFFRNLLHLCDGAARFEADADDLRHILYRRSLDRVKTHHIRNWLAELHRVGLVQLYTSEGRGYGTVPKFGQRDYLRAKRYPPPPGEPELPLATGDPPEPATRPAKKSEVKRIEGKGRESAQGAPNPQPPPIDYSLDALRMRWPALDIDDELAKALAFKRQTNGPGAKLDLAWFENHWLTGCGPTYTGATKPADAKPWESECPRWRELVADTAYGPGCTFEATSWAGLPPDVKQEVWRQSKSQEG
jgi:hypothetical protein